MEIKGFSECIATNKQQWCCLVAAASCGIVAACEFFVCKLVSFAALSCSNLAALSCSNLAALSCSNLVALSCSNLAALFVQRVCRPSRLFLIGGVGLKITNLKKTVQRKVMCHPYV